MIFLNFQDYIYGKTQFVFILMVILIALSISAVIGSIVSLAHCRQNDNDKFKVVSILGLLFGVIGLIIPVVGLVGYVLTVMSSCMDKKGRNILVFCIVTVVIGICAVAIFYWQFRTDIEHYQNTTGQEIHTEQASSGIGEIEVAVPDDILVIGFKQGTTAEEIADFEKQVIKRSEVDHLESERKEDDASGNPTRYRIVLVKGKPKNALKEYLESFECVEEVD